MTVEHCRRICVGSVRAARSFVSVAAALAALVHCVGDNPLEEGDSGTDATSDQLVGGDAGDAGDVETDALMAVCNVSTPFNPPTLVTSLDSTGSEGRFDLSSDYLTGYFDIAPQDGGATKLYSATRSAILAPFGAAAVIPGLYSSASVSGDARPSVSGDGLSLFFHTNLSADAGGLGSNDVVRSTRLHVGDAWGTPAPLANVDSVNFEGNPFIREDGMELYFTFEVGSGPGQIYRALSADGAAFDAPTAVSELASSGAEGAMTVTPDDLVIYFDSTRTDGGAKGIRDIWVAWRDSPTAPFGTPSNVSELNTPDVDTPDFITRDRCTLYFHRNVVMDAGVTVRTIWMATKSP